MSKVLGMLFIVQSAVQPPNYLSEKILEFLDGMKKEITTLSDEDFNSYRESILTRLREKDYNVAQEAGRYWSEIAKHAYFFNRSNFYYL